jgi:small subunit ribosomal protein S17
VSNEQENTPATIDETQAPIAGDTEAGPAEGSANDEADASERVSGERAIDTERASSERAIDTERVSSERAIDTSKRAARKSREGVVVSNGMDKTAVVAVIERVRHPKYNKFVLQTKKLYAHDEANDLNVGDRVRVMETRPLSKQKRWRVTEVLERAK